MPLLEYMSGFEKEVGELRAATQTLTQQLNEERRRAEALAEVKREGLTVQFVADVIWSAVSSPPTTRRKWPCPGSSRPGIVNRTVCHAWNTGRGSPATRTVPS